MPTKRLVLLGLALILAVVGCGGTTLSPTPAPTSCPTPVFDPSASPPRVIPSCVIITHDQPTQSPTPSASGSLEAWDGFAELTSTAVYPNNDTCKDGWNVAFRFAVDAAGTVEGSGTADLTSPPVCLSMGGADPAALSWRHVEYRVTGLRAVSEVTLTFTLTSYTPEGAASMAGLHAMVSAAGGVPTPVAIPTAAGRGQGPVKWQFASGNPAAIYTASGTMTVTCGACR